MITVELEGSRFEFEHVQFKAGGMDAVLTVYRATPKDPVLADRFVSKPFRYHISGRSLSNITAYRRELEKFHGQDIEWNRLLHEAIGQAEAQYKEQAHSLDPWEREDEVTGDLVEETFPLNMPSVVFGMGGDGKSLGTLSALAAASMKNQWVGRVTNGANVLWLDYESEHEGDIGARRGALARGGLEFYPGSLRWMPARGIPLSDLAPQVGEEMQRFHCTVFVLDSVAFACGGKPETSEAATTFFAALATLPMSTKILIAHTDKAENDKYPFGSIFWHNGIHGMSWYVKAHEEFGELTMGWYNRKHSSRPRPQDFAIRFLFKDTAIQVESGSLAQINRELGREPEGIRITQTLLTHGKLTVPEIVELTGISTQNVAANLSKMKTKGVVSNEGRGRGWSVVDNEHM